MWDDTYPPDEENTMNTNIPYDLEHDDDTEEMAPYEYRLAYANADLDFPDWDLFPEEPSLLDSLENDAGLEPSTDGSLGIASAHHSIKVKTI